jgi:hypothetical protein
MRTLLLASAAAATMALGIAAANAQSPEPRRDQRPDASATQETSPKAGNTDRGRTRDDRAKPSAEDGKSSSQGAKAADERQRGQSGARVQQNENRGSSPEKAGTQGQRTGSETDRGAGKPTQEKDSAQDGRVGQDTTSDRPRSSDRSRRDDGRNRDQTSESPAPAESSRPKGNRFDRTTTRERDTNRVGQLSLSKEERTRVTTRFSAQIDRMNVRPVTRTNISISIGASVPRSVRVYDVPQDVIAIYPRFRGHRFVVVEDEIVILEPQSRRIVATLPRDVGSHASRRAGNASARAGIGLSTEKRRVIREIVLREPACRFEQRLDFTIGIPIPRSVRVCEFPDEVLADVPEVRSYRFVVRDDDIVVVDPNEHRIVEVIE